MEAIKDFTISNRNMAVQARVASVVRPRQQAKNASAHIKHIETVQLVSTTGRLSMIASTDSSTDALAPDTGSDRSSLSPRSTMINSQYPPSVLDVIPLSFHEYYSDEVFEKFPPEESLFKPSDGVLSSFGLVDLYLRRPSFTHRDVVNWELNDLRSLCILHDPIPERPDIFSFNLKEDRFEARIIPLTFTPEQIAAGLALSDLYKESEFTAFHRAELAYQTIQLCDPREIAPNYRPLTKQEWRRIIDYYLLALGCETQARLDFHAALASRVYKKLDKSNLLKRVLLNRAVSSNANKTRNDVNRLVPNNSTPSPSKTNLGAILARTTGSIFGSLNKPDKQSVNPAQVVPRSEQKILWREVQLSVYKRLGLAWEPSELRF
ncbi:hypothetical protein V1514DRAFT_324942 [Lipomyces japonicus]|uniref:uncharacterized protein n=1 Tax=Lipomyces japonicus TaxID=56871 RepID=UPI0034CEDC3A